jgi:small GTP-binding protein
MENELPTFVFKMVLVGNSAVGKSSLVNRFCFKTFNANLDTTVGAAYASHVCTLEKSKIEFEIWDTAG